MEFQHVKTYEKNMLTENFYIDGQDVDEWVYDTLDNDCFDNIKNIKKSNKKIIKDVAHGFSISDVKNADEFDAAVGSIINNIKMSNVADGVEILRTIISSMGNEFYLQGYLDCLHTNVEDSKKRIVNFIKKNNRRG